MISLLFGHFNKKKKEKKREENAIGGCEKGKKGAYIIFIARLIQWFNYLKRTFYVRSKWAIARFSISRETPRTWGVKLISWARCATTRQQKNTKLMCMNLFVITMTTTATMETMAVAVAATAEMMARDSKFSIFKRNLYGVEHKHTSSILLAKFQAKKTFCLVTPYQKPILKQQQQQNSFDSMVLSLVSNMWRLFLSFVRADLMSLCWDVEWMQDCQSVCQRINSCKKEKKCPCKVVYRTFRKPCCERTKFQVEAVEKLLQLINTW